MAELVPIRVSELPSTSEAQGTNYLILDDGVETKKISVDDYNNSSNQTAKAYADEAALSAQHSQDYSNASRQSSDTSAAKAQESNTYAFNSEAWAVGQRNGSDVEATDPTYNNNAKYYAGNAGASATAAAGSATSAASSATAAAGSATEADASADRAQEILDSIPEDYSELSEDVANLSSALETGTIKSDIALRFVSGENVKSTTGEIQTNGSYTRTDYMEITDEKALTLFWTTSHGTTLNALCFYDQSKTCISGGANPLTNADDTHTHSIPKNAKYFIFSGTNTAMGKVGAEYVIPFIKPWCYGKKINWIGDSIVDGNDFDEKVTAALGLDETDYGINGSTIALNGDGTDGRHALCVRYADMTDDTDIIAVSCGTNDFEYAWSPIGDIESTENTTFYGALKTLCAGLIAKYPQKLIFFTTPIKRAQAFENGNGGEYTADGVMTTPFSKNKYGKTLMDYADIIKEVCGYYSIPVLDLNRESLLNPHLTAQQSMFDNVYTHPNTTGQAIMARRVAGWLMQLGYEV